MAGAFPTLRNGQAVMYPLQDTRSFGSGVVRFLDDTEQRWRSRLMLTRFILEYKNINGYDLAVLTTFFNSQFGKFDATWSITFGGETFDDMMFDQDEMPAVESMGNHFNVSFRCQQMISADPSIPALATYFPQISASGVMTQLPYPVESAYLTTMVDLPTGRRYGFKWRAAPLRLFGINYSVITDAEKDVVKDFFYSAEGKFRGFKFVDPNGNLVNFSDDFSDSSWIRTSVTVGASATDPFGGNLATTLTGGVGNSFMRTIVLPAGGASGMLLTLSAWIKSASAGQTLRILFINSDTNGDLDSLDVDLPQGVWTRVHHTFTLASAVNVGIRFGGNSSWGTVSHDFFAVQCVNTPGPGPRLLTPGADGLFNLCRFDTDDFANRLNQNGINAMTIPIAQFA